MKINELIQEFTIQATNEERVVMQKCGTVRSLDSFSERDRFIIEALIRKSLVSKIVQNGTVMVVINEF
mgnify:FL=1|jgi:hypothetical protein|tara:strand:- start:1137 stop:1340 length:204 start_codon:yes stop_codon:yes gene_type:complete